MPDKFYYIFNSNVVSNVDDTSVFVLGKTKNEVIINNGVTIKKHVHFLKTWL